MKKIYCIKNAMNFFKKEIALSLLILLSVTVYSSPIDENTVRKEGYNFFAGRPSFTSRPNSKGEGSYSIADCSYTLSANSEVTSGAGTGTVTVTAAGEACTWTATKSANWITFTSSQSGIGNGSVGYSYTANTAWSSRTGTITIAGQTYTVTQLPPTLALDSYEGTTGNNTSAQAYTFSPVFNNENASTTSISDANCHNVADVDIYKINLEAGYIYTIGGALYDVANQTAGSSYTLDAKISYSTNGGSTWTYWGDDQLSNKTVQEGTLYLKIEPDYRGYVGTYAARIDIKKAATAGCTYTLLPVSIEPTAEEGNGQIGVTTIGTSCLRTATSNANWITLTSGQSTTGSGNVAYSYKANMATVSRTGTIIIADKTFTITQAGRPLILDSYEPNNTIAEAAQASTFTPTLTENAGNVSILPASCHNSTDIDIYKINLAAGYSYTISGALYGRHNQIDNSNYTLYGKISYSTDGSDWTYWGADQLSNKTMQGETLYLKIEPNSSYSWYVGTYAAKIDIKKAATIGCTYTLPVVSKEVTWEAKTGQQAEVRASSSANLSCIWTATSNVNWITLTSGQSGTGNGTVGYSYTANTTWSSRIGTITIGGKTYTVTQLPPSLAPDSYEGTTGNNTSVLARSLSEPVFNNENASTTSISDANCHNVADVDYYKINLEAGYSYTVSGALYGSDNQINNSNYTLSPYIYYSTDGSDWDYWGYSQLSNKAVQGGTLYLKVTSSYGRNVGTYGVKIDIKKTASTGCIYALLPTRKEVTSVAGNGQVSVTTGLSCLRTATSNVSWITLTSGQSGTGLGSVAYSYTENTTLSSRTGTISIAGRTHTVTQLPPMLTPDGYEGSTGNNTLEQASLLATTFTDNAGTISISPANCHNVADVDIYKINLEANYSYTISGALYGPYNQINNSSYTLNAKASYSTDASTWTYWGSSYSQLSSKTVQGGETLYLKIVPYSQGNVGTYAASINLSRTAGCTYNLSAKSKEATAPEGTGLVTVTASSLCTSPWTATVASTANWITLTPDQSGTTGTGEVGYSYTANTAPGSRTGTITIASQTYTVTQAGTLQPDGYEPNNTVAEVGLRSSFTPAFTQNTGTVSISANYHTKEDVDIYKITLGPDLYTLSVLYDGNQANVTYSTDGSNWSYSSSWTTDNQYLIPAVQGEALYLKIDPNYNNYNNYESSVGTYSVKIDINTAASTSCAYTLPVKGREVTAGAGSGKVDVTTDASCIWAAASNRDWIKVASNRSTTGSGSVRYSYEENTTPNSRTGTITVAGQTYTVTQASIRRDAYEKNNTVANASVLTPLFTQNTSTISISANCHIKEDIDIYKIDTGTDTYAINVVVQSRNYSFDAKISYSTNAGSTWTESTGSKLPGLTVQGTFYLKIEPKNSNWYSVGSYEAGIAINIAATAGCTYTLSAADRQARWEAGFGKVEIGTTGSCVWSAVSNAEWISLASSRSITGSGSVDYSYTENTSTESRIGTITVAGQTYTVTQGPIQADGYEENNTVAQVNSNSLSSFTPVFPQNASRIFISPANCHSADDVDIYKINLGADSCIVSGMLYGKNYPNNNSRYTLNTKISYSTDGTAWSTPAEFLPNLTAKGTLYLKIVPDAEGKVGSYAMRIAINKSSAAGCTYSLLAADKQATWQAGSDQISVSTDPSCVWAATTNAGWITVAQESITGSSSVGYSYEENTTASSRIGKITVAGKVYKVTQAPIQADAYEENNTVAQADLRPSLTPVFPQNQNTSTLSISPANCHTSTDVDIYKINLGTDSCVVSAVLHDWYNRYSNNYYDNRYTLEAKISYSTDGSIWKSGRFSNVGMRGTLYLKVEPYSSNPNYGGTTGSYAVKIEISKAATAGCTYSLTAAGREATAEAGAGQVEVTTNSSCAWAAASNVGWISLASGRSGTGSGSVGYTYPLVSFEEWLLSGTGSGSVGYTYTENTAIASRTGTITAAGKTYIITQAAAQSLSPDSYEPNDTKETAYSLTPVFTQNTSTLSISAANCHHADDVDIYKINLGTGYNSYTVSGELYDKNSDKKNHTLNAQVSYSTDGATWYKPEGGRLRGLTVAGGTLYLKIVSDYSYSSYNYNYNYKKYPGSYAAKIDITGGCTYSLSSVSTQVESEAGSGQVAVTANSSGSASCPWAATSNVGWITVTSVQSGTGSGSVSYAYTKNTTSSSRTGMITIVGQTYTVTQAAAPPLAPDGYEENNTVGEARVLTPVFTQNVGTVSISAANCHIVDDLDIYKINFGTDYDSYTVSGVLYDRNNQIDNSSYTFDGELYYLTNGSKWTRLKSNRLPNLIVASGGTLYLAISPGFKESIGTYAAKIDITGGCTYSLPVAAGEVAYEAGTGQVAVMVNSSGSVSCPRIATSNVDWIMLTPGQSGTGSGNVGYSYTENTEASPRTGTITVAGYTYTVTQAPVRPLSPDTYEPNNTVAKATLLTPVFTQNAGTLSILQVNCHNADDVDIYKINLEAGSYTVSAILSDSYNDSHYTLDAKISYSTDGASWSESKDSQLTGLTVPGGTLYLRIEPFSGVGTYAAKIDVLKIIEGCAYTLSAVSKQATYEAGSDQVTVTTGSSCAWTATANVTWITFTSDRSRTGTGNLGYSYTENMSLDSRAGIITIAGQTYTVTQTAHPLLADSYEENNTVEQAGARSSFTPVFTQNASRISISPASCHHVDDVDIYKINLETGYSYAVSTVLSDRSSRINNNNYTLDARISYSTDGTNWSKEYRQLSTLTVPGGILYLKIAPYYYGNRVGFYAAKIDIKITGGCTYKLSATSKEATAAAGTGKIEVTAASLCGWTATSNADWITIKSGQIGKVSGSVEYAYAENKTASSRTGTITVGDQTFTLNQSIVTGLETTPGVRIFPNPARDFVTIDLSSTNIKWMSVKISNQLGQILYELDNPNGKLQIPLKGLTAGLYFILLQGEEKVGVQKLIVE